MSEFAAYVAAGWKICAIDRGKKAPTYPRWQVEPIPADAAAGIDGAGLLHALSGTCALDVDDLTAAAPWLAERGVDLEALLDAPDAVRIDSGRPGRAKLLYRLKRPLRTLKPPGSGLELRCATASGTSAQDVLPPSLHPDTGKAYQWVYGDLLAGHWSRLPAIPVALVGLWRELAEPITDKPIAAQTTAPAVDLAAMRKAAFRHSPDAEYNEWLRVGMQLHQGTGGAQEGFDIWAEWSRGVKRIKYPGDEVLKRHWLSFNSSDGKRLASGAALVAELPAEADEFPIVEAPKPGELTTAEQEDIIKAVSRKTAIEALEKRLVFVHSAERYFDCERHKIIGSDNAIEHMFGHLVTGKGGPVKALKQSRTKQFVDGVGFHPGAAAIFTHDDDSFANMYRDRLPAPIEPAQGERERIEWLFDRIDDPMYRQWLLQFLAHVVQRPGVKIKSAPLIWSDAQGNGKTTLLKVIPSLLVGMRYSKEVTSGLLNSDFNDYLLNAWHVNLTEFRAGTRGEREAITEKLKPWITDDTIGIHPKGQAGYTMPNHFFVTATSNKDDAAAVDNNDRRWAIHEMHAPQFTEEEQSWIYNDFLLLPRAAGVLRHYFLNVSLDGFAASAKAPETTARQEMAEASMPGDLELLITAWEQHSEPLTRDIVLPHEVAAYVCKHSMMKPSAHRIGKMLCKPPFNGKPIRFRAGEGVYRGTVLRNYDRWGGAKGADIWAHISGDDVDLLT